MARVLAIDFGGKRCGIAVTDEFQIIASSLTTVETATIFDFLKKYFSNEKVEAVVIGEPKNLNNTDTHATLPVKRFTEKFKQTFPEMPVVMVDERFTSKMAMQSMVMSGVKKIGKEKQRID